MHKKRLLFIGGYPNPVDKYKRVFFQNLIREIADQGVECHVIAPVSITHYKKNINEIPDQMQDMTERKNRINVYYPRYLSFSSKAMGVFNTGVLSERAFRSAAYGVAKSLEVRFDAVYGHFFLTGGLAAVFIGNKLGLPSYIAYGECDYVSQVKQGFRDLKKKDVEGLSGIISVSSKNSEELKRVGLFDKTQILLCPNAINNQDFYKKDKKAAREKLHIPQDIFVAGFVGGFIERKGPMRVMEACREMDDVYLAFAGDGVERPEGERVLFAKPLGHDQICDFLNALDVFVLPTLSEGCCNSVLEAMAVGCTIITSKLSFNFDIVDEKCAMLIDPLNIEEIENAIRQLKQDTSLRNTLAERALLRASEYGITKRAKKILEFIYETEID